MIWDCDGGDVMGEGLRNKDNWLDVIDNFLYVVDI